MLVEIPLNSSIFILMSFPTHPHRRCEKIANYKNIKSNLSIYLLYLYINFWVIGWGTLKIPGPPLKLLPAALLIFLAAAAGAGVVAAHLFLLALLGLGAAAVAVAEHHGLLGRPGLRRRFMVGFHLEVEQGAHRVRLNAVDQVHEHLIAFPLVFPQGVHLGVAPEPDAVPEVVHGQEVIFPVVVHDLEHDHLLQLLKEFGADLVALGREALFHQVEEDVVDVMVQVAVQVFQGDPEAELPVGGVSQGLEVPLLRHFVGGVFLDDLLHQFGGHIHEVFFEG